MHQEREVKLRPKAFEVLTYLVENSGRLVGKEELIRAVWPDTFVTDDSLVKCLKDVRVALQDDSQFHIKTVPRRGYVFTTQVRENEDVSAEAFLPASPGRQVEYPRGVIDSTVDDQDSAFRIAETSVSPSTVQFPYSARVRRFSWTALVMVLGVLVVTSAALLAYSRYYNRSQVPSAPVGSIAVLPLRNLSGDPTNDYFSDGMTDSLITALSKVEGLKVISRGSVFRFKGQEVDPREVGKQLSVAAVLEGSVRKDGESVRVGVRLVSVDDGRVLWTGEMYNRALRDIFALQDDIARSVAAGLKLELSGEGERQLARRYTDNVEAYQYYLKGRYYWNKRTEEGLKQGIEYFEEAIAKDPRYAQAYAGLADSYILMGVGDYSVLPPKEAMPKAKEAALKALAIDETLAEAHTSLGFLNYVFDWDWSGAESHFRRAIELNPNYVTAHHWYGLYLGVMGRFDEGIEQAQRAVELDPSSPIINTDLGLIFCYARQPDRAIEQLKKTLAREPDFVVARWRLARAYAQKAMYQEAISELQKAIDASGRKPYYLSLMGYVQAHAGNRAEALKIVKELQGLPQGQENWPALIATVYVGLGDKDRAFEWLDRAYQERFTALIGLKVEPMFDNLRSDPRFAALVRRVGLAS
ncbi:MAG: tetratricopeptide repeat protein [Pyrinomonadaceae bacterium]|nr:tetratricopeptide repeat protein [Pyrinomonadaceae bacterium]